MCAHSPDAQLAVSLILEGWQIEVDQRGVRLRPTTCVTRRLSSVEGLRALEQKIHGQLAADGPERQRVLGELMTVDDATALLGVIPRVVNGWLRSEILPGLKLEGRWFVTKAWVAMFRLQAERTRIPEQKCDLDRFVSRTVAFARVHYVRAEPREGTATPSAENSSEGGEAS